MIHSSNIRTLRTHIQQWKQQGKSIALVPTMGNLHKGHLALVDRAHQLADITVATVFVNPAQFDNPDDLNAYPRTLDSDARQLQERDCDLLFAPDTQVMYGDKPSPTRVEAGAISTQLEGESRPGHFSGVATIVSKLFNLTTPDMAIFGEKDYQQLLVIRQLVEDLNYDIQIIGHPTVREADGLAMSSRNGYLTTEERLAAPMLYSTLQWLKQQLRQGNNNHSELLTQAKNRLAEHGFKPDYIEIRRQKDLQHPNNNDQKLIILASAWLGKARLIDNLAFQTGDLD